MTTKIEWPHKILREMLNFYRELDIDIRYSIKKSGEKKNTKIFCTLGVNFPNQILLIFLWFPYYQRQYFFKSSYQFLESSLSIPIFSQMTLSIFLKVSIYSDYWYVIEIYRTPLLPRAGVYWEILPKGQYLQSGQQHQCFHFHSCCRLSGVGNPKSLN